MNHGTRKALAGSVFMGVMLLAAAHAGEAPKINVAEGYRSPTLTVPYASVKPVIDGVINDAEWQGAASFSQIQTIGGAISARPTRFWIMWDEQNLYVAMRSPLRQGERPLQADRNRQRDGNGIIYDDSYEIWITVGASDPLTNQPDCTTQFLANFSGARYDLLHQPAVGNSRLGYSTHWEPNNRISDKNDWEWEMIVPRESLGKQEGKEFKEGFVFHTLFARNFKRPWEQNSFEGTSSFSVVDTHTTCVMSKSAPALHLLKVADNASKTLGLTLAAMGQKDGNVTWTFASDSGVTKTETVAVKKGELISLADLKELDTLGEGRFRVSATMPGAKLPLLDWSAKRAIGFETKHEKKTVDGKETTVAVNVDQGLATINDKGDVLNLHAYLNPVKDYVRVTGDLINFDERTKIAKITAVLKDAAGTTLCTFEPTIDEYAYAKGVMVLDKPLGPGDYTVEVACLDAAGKPVATRTAKITKKDPKTFAWWNTPHGNIEKVIKPWTPVTWKRDTFGVWGREMKLAAGGLFSSIKTQGMEVLAAPMQLVAEMPDGKTVAATGDRAKLTFDKDWRKTASVESTLGDLAIESTGSIEFDGLYKLTMKLTPKKPTTVKSLKVVIPYVDSEGAYIHAVADEIRSGFHYGFVPKGTGRVWDSTLLGSGAMVAGSFVPYVWLGNSGGGLCFMADGDEGWVPSDTTPAIEIVRNAEGRFDLVLNLISSEFTIDAPRTVTLGFQASPVKEMHKGWRLDTWWCGHTFTNPDYGGHGPTGLIWNSTPFVLPKHVEACKKLVESKHKAGAPAVPYFIHESLPAQHVPEVGYFGEHWRCSIDRCLCFNKTLIDYMVHHYAEWAKECGIDGFYSDNIRPVVCDNIEAGRGYRLPDGRVQPTYQMFDTRDYFLRLRAAFQEQRGDSKIVLHMTNSMVIPWIGAADVAYDGEHHVIYPEMEKDFMDFWTLERLRVDYPGMWGVAINFMQEYQKQWEPRQLTLAYRAYFGALILHDTLATGNSNGHERELVRIQREFGLGDDDVRFLPYWNAQTGLSGHTETVKLAGWAKPDRMLVAVVNFGEKAMAEVRIDPKQLGWNAGTKLTVRDAEAGLRIGGYNNKLRKQINNYANAEDDFPVAFVPEKNTVFVTVNRHNYRLLIVEPAK